MSHGKSPATLYDDGPVRGFAVAAVVWGVVGMAVGVFIAAQLAWPVLAAGIPRCTAVITPPSAA